MSDSLFARLLKAVGKDPCLEYDLWKQMQSINFYRPWKNNVLKDDEGEVIASIEVMSNGRVWRGIIFGDSTGRLNPDSAPVRLESDSAEDIKGRIEAILCARQWREIPAERRKIPSL